MPQPKRDLANTLTGRRHCKPAAQLHEAGEADAVHKLHDEEVQLARLLGVVGADDVGVVELGSGLDLAAEAFDCRGVAREAAAEDLQRDGPLHDAVLGLVDDSYAALT